MCHSRLALDSKIDRRNYYNCDIEHKLTACGREYVFTLCPLIFTPLFTFIRPESYDFEKFKEVKPADDYEDGDTTRVQETAAEREFAMEVAQTHQEKNGQILLRARKWAIYASIAMTLIFLILWPIPMYATSYGKESH